MWTTRGVRIVWACASVVAGGCVGGQEGGLEVDLAATATMQHLLAPTMMLGRVRDIALGNVDGDAEAEVALVYDGTDGRRLLLLDDELHGYQQIADLSGSCETPATHVAFGKRASGTDLLAIGNALTTSGTRRFCVIEVTQTSPTATYAVRFQGPPSGEAWGSGVQLSALAFDSVDGDETGELLVGRSASSGYRYWVYDPDAATAFARMYRGGANWGTGSVSHLGTFQNVNSPPIGGTKLVATGGASDPFVDLIGDVAASASLDRVPGAEDSGLGEAMLGSAIALPAMHVTSHVGGNHALSGTQVRVVRGTFRADFAGLANTQPDRAQAIFHMHHVVATQPVNTEGGSNMYQVGFKLHVAPSDDQSVVYVMWRVRFDDVGALPQIVIKPKYGGEYQEAEAKYYRSTPITNATNELLKGQPMRFEAELGAVGDGCAANARPLRVRISSTRDFTAPSLWANDGVGGRPSPHCISTSILSSVGNLVHGVRTDNVSVDVFPQ